MDTKCQGPQRLNMGIGKAFPRSGSGNCHNLSPIHIQILTMCAKASNHALLPLEWLEPGAALLQTPLMDGSQTGLLIQLYTAKLPLQFGCINTLYEAPGLLWLWVPSIWVTTVHPILDFLYVSLLFLQCHLDQVMQQRCGRESLVRYRLVHIQWGAFLILESWLPHFMN